MVCLVDESEGVVLHPTGAECGCCSDAYSTSSSIIRDRLSYGRLAYLAEKGIDLRPHLIFPSFLFSVPAPRPPKAPLHLNGSNNGAYTLAVRIVMDVTKAPIRFATIAA
jgi:hypothetical protein